MERRHLSLALIAVPGLWIIDPGIQAVVAALRSDMTRTQSPQRGYSLRSLANPFIAIYLIAVNNVLPTVNIRDLNLEEFLLLKDGHCLRDQVLEFCTTVLQHSPDASAQHTSLTTLVALVGAGSGLRSVRARFRLNGANRGNREMKAP